MVASRHRETAALKLIVVYILQRFRTRADVDDLWQTDQPGSFNENQTQWLTLQLCLATVGVTEWIECSRLDHLF